ncbi:hypothetical protein [Candidatus Williamhamiltonella defendens]|uniref:Uncharacterized protein n=1 Tax=Candidatus Hamiltonella defensa (Bemisia tabaci) TaxID=672795 RepID=A0A249DWJ2_9ENTR|nr:hypothetical protein [Candidatus Hamiltonella defensa]ASX25918.1 hypothetical protein BA171_01905 [Candidatus Hamiltonella defensa (Bemisia tabaci)]CED79080.1 Conserved hypothetical protein [Candidatus Hamiltonella defensa (Bemisia tabaci)]
MSADFKTPFRYTGISQEEAGFLTHHYQQRGYRMRKYLNEDMTLWDVVVSLPERDRFPNPPFLMLNPLRAVRNHHLRQD